jgi:hypothetical protein
MLNIEKNFYILTSLIGTKDLPDARKPLYSSKIEDKNNDTEINPENISVDIQDTGVDKPKNQNNKNIENIKGIENVENFENN